MPYTGRNPQKLRILLPKTERRLDGTGVIGIRWSDKGGEACVPYVTAGRHRACEQRGNRHEAKPTLRVVLLLVCSQADPLGLLAAHKAEEPESWFCRVVHVGENCSCLLQPCLEVVRKVKFSSTGPSSLLVHFMVR